ncbi:isoprenylcysteine carboxylmethyltransferase family protein [Microvirga vignae]|nr:isoprenylcysteine carboxylmethyltransferase family protein [Microvirga vignae]
MPVWPLHGAIPDQHRRNRVAIKLIGLAGIYALLGLAYWVLPIYQRDFRHFFIFITPAIPIILLTAPVYVWLTDRSMKEPVDGCFMTGLALIGRWGDVSWKLVRNYAAGWLVKGFFLPFMLEAAFHDVQWFLATDLKSQLLESQYGWYELTFRTLYGVDVIWGSTGYLMTLRLFQTHVRSTENTLDGWLICLICYAPFWALIYGNYLNYEDGFYWAYWLSDQPVLRALWGAAILALTVIYCWATISFGARFSNLTHRGILTNGPYRWSKHPAYIAKNLSWWLISMPFLSAGGPADAVRFSLLLLGVNAIYYWRAKTEERHLSADPVYQRYTQWIATYGLLAMLKALFIRSYKVMQGRNLPI